MTTKRGRGEKKRTINLELCPGERSSAYSQTERTTSCRSSGQSTQSAEDGDGSDVKKSRSGCGKIGNGIVSTEAKG